jgi:hypothetical protein
MGAASPDLEKQGFSSVVFIYREYSGQQEDGFLKTPIGLLLKNSKVFLKNNVLKSRDCCAFY